MAGAFTDYLRFLFGWKSSTGAVPDRPGLEFVVPESLSHYRIPENFTHHVMPENLAHFVVPAEDD